MNLAKLCRVCGDEALCFNFNGLSCEACKVFFRRNLTKQFVCKSANNCLVNTSTRKFCKRCRMDKCFAIGMKKELISTFKERSTVVQPMPNYISNYNQELQPYDLLQIGEIERAAGHLPNEHNQPLIGGSDDLACLANLSDHYARRTIKYCRAIEAFRQLKPTDQLQLMKSFYSEMYAIQMSFIYMEEKDGLRLLNETGKETIFVKMEMSDYIAAKGYERMFHEFASPLRVIMENDAIIRNLIITQLLFKPRGNTANPELVNYNYSRCCHLLRKYLRLKFKCAGDTKFTSLMVVLGMVGRASQLYDNFFKQEFAPDQLPEVVRDIYDIKL